MKFFVGKLIAFRNRHDVVHVLKDDKVFSGNAGFIAYNADDGNLFSFGKMNG